MKGKTVTIHRKTPRQLPPKIRTCWTINILLESFLSLLLWISVASFKQGVSLAILVLSLAVHGFLGSKQKTNKHKTQTFFWRTPRDNCPKKEPHPPQGQKWWLYCPSAQNMAGLSQVGSKKAHKKKKSHKISERPLQGRVPGTPGRPLAAMA